MPSGLQAPCSHNWLPKRCWGMPSLSHVCLLLQVQIRIQGIQGLLHGHGHCLMGGNVYVRISIVDSSTGNIVDCPMNAHPNQAVPSPGLRVRVSGEGETVRFEHHETKIGWCTSSLPDR